MLKECLEVFQHELEKKGDKIILDTYVPADGTYVIVEPKDDSFGIKEVVNIKQNKKTKEIDRSNKYFDDICVWDYNSKIINTNKPMASKKYVTKKIILSNNYMSFISKKENIKNGKLTIDIIDNYYDTLTNPYLKYEKEKNKEIYKKVEEEIGSVDKDKIQKIRCWIKNNLYKIDIDYDQKDYIKIFFKYDIEEYIREGKRYLIPNIYNKNELNIEVNKVLYGLSDNNMGFNTKKTYLENKSRKLIQPYLIDKNEAILQKKFFDYLYNLVSLGKCNIFIDNVNMKILSFENGKSPKGKFSGIFLRILKGKNEAEIHDYDIITKYKYNLIKKFEFKNILNIDLASKNVSIQKYGVCTTIKDIESILSEVFFKNILIKNYFTDPGDLKINDGCLKSNLLLARESLFNWIYKGIDNGVFKILNRISLSLVKGSIVNGYIIKSSHQFNLRWSLIEYFEKGNDDMADIIFNLKETLRNKINSPTTDKFENDDEYYFAVGQLVSYLLAKNKGNKKMHSLANPFINAKNNELIKEKLRNFYKKYNYDINMNGRRFKNLYAMILGYKPESSVNQDMIIAGYLNSSLIYESNNKEEI
ncbi:MULTISPECIES: type I-B CRISPR-associated protein Cas8b/Csh1 [unclassified Clostridium]|uniref:type I-B CRISPR-associated protein Cas8b/Csh1 n=1 Tax=unclassified Clostridium TaxID=2614128 RepID=UPI0013F10860|nr:MULTISPECIES: type I-B CRISPR-associated protein Cas8b/Csh1 [unclassified Clostridium]NFG62984.1 type I-B CRISPR-associated protein Cas8b/Csh1 [Clostridium botulinum]NFQ09300.1 type I-B CRISPR-associated protein Cas8b/Csh1 [Clostridium botulinum]